MMKTNLFIVVLLFPMLLQAQTDKPLHFKRIQGLSQNTVYSILVDQQGFMWIATADGLNRFDGINMKSYKPEIGNHKRNFSDRIIRSKLLEDETERIWLSTGTGTYSYNKKNDFFEFRYISLKKGGLPWSINPISIEGNLVWGSNNHGRLFEYNRKTNEWNSYGSGATPDKDIPFTDGVKDGQGNFWFITDPGILYFDKTRKQWEHFFTDKIFTGIGIVKDSLYLSIHHEVFACNTRSLQLGKIDISKIDNPGALHVFFTDKKNNLWAGDKNGNIFCKKESSVIFTWRGNINGENVSGSFYPVYCLFVDDNDILWAGADVLGLQKAHLGQSAFTSFPVPGKNEKKEYLFIHSICEVDDQIWLGTYRQGLWIVDKTNRTGKKLNFPFSKTKDADSNSISLVYRDNHQNLWIGTYNDLYVREKGRSGFKKIFGISKPGGLFKTGIRPFAVTGYNDSLYFATSWGIYSVFKKGNEFKTYYYKKTGAGFFYDIFIDNNRNFWIATENGIIVKKDLDQTFGFNNTDTILFKGVGIKSFLHDPSTNILWISSTSGLISMHVSTGAYKIFTEANGMCNSYVYGIIKNDNELWISTNKGLSKAIINFTGDRVLPQLRFTNFTSADGLPDDEFNTGAFHKGQSGELYFGTIKGIVWFRATDMQPNRLLPKILLTDLFANDQPADSIMAAEYISKLSLPYFRNNLFFGFRGIEFVNPGSVTYAYKLEDWDKDWINSGTLSQVRYNNLPPGKYLFKVKAANSSGIWNENYHTVSIIILPPFWRTWWFYSLISIAVMLSIVLITRFFSQQKLKARVNELEKQKEIDKERLRISREMHDDIGAGLTQITLISESAKNKMHMQALDDIAGTSRQLVNNMSEIIWSLNPENKTLDQLCAYLREELTKQLDYTGKNFNISLPDHRKDIILSNELRRNILLVTKEIVNNAVKYSNATLIKIKAEVKQNKLMFDVGDDGTGFDPKKKYPGNGLKNIATRVEESGGTMEIETAAGCGSRFIYWFPV